MLAIPSEQRRGGLALLWMEDVDLHIQTYSPNHIDALILNGSDPPWRLTGFYRWPEEQRKRESWQLLKHLHTRFAVPWLCCGDFNEILQSSEKQGRLPKQQQPMMEFRVALLHCGLVDLGFQGNIFTWNNGHPRDAFVQEWLDKACANSEWRSLFPHAKVIHIQSSYSDHNPIIINISMPNQTYRKKKIPGRFEEKWAYHEGCEAVVRVAWDAKSGVGSPMFRLFEKIRRCRQALIEWSRNIVGNFKTKIQERQSALEELALQNNPANQPTIKALKNEINALLHQDEVYWQQRSRSIWLPTGDKNTKFFHQRASQRCRKNHISGITSQTGVWCHFDDQIAKTSINYFKDLFTSSNPIDFSGVLQAMDQVVTLDMNTTLLQRYNSKEVKQALFQMQPSKSPGLDGMPPFFFQKYWHIVGQDITIVVL